MNNNHHIDLHVHTTFSDGSFTPKQVIEFCKHKGIVAVSITDHDSTDGIEEAVKLGTKMCIEVIPGVELSAELKDSAEEEIHILGYFINWEDKTLQQKLKIFREARKQRAYQIFKKLQKLGIKLNEEKIFHETNQGSIGRLHFAKEMLNCNYVKSIKEAFELYLSYGKPAFVPKLKLSPEEAIKMILTTGGIPVLAHPYFSNYLDLRFIKKLINYGLKGIEVYHSKHPKNVVEELLTIAEKYNLLITGGSDCHGEVGDTPPLLGTLNIPYVLLEKLKLYKQEIENYRSKILFSQQNTSVS